MSLRSSPDRYGSMAIAIHWLSAAVILALLATGLMAADQADAAAKLALLRLHLPLGIAVLLLTLLRIVWWVWADKRPLPPAGQAPWQDLLARLVHGGLYIIILVMAASGIATIALSGALPAILSGAALPDLATVPPRLVHGVGARLTLALLALHVGAALYHQFIRRDRLLARMGLGA